MQYITNYQSPLGKILLAADEEGLIGVWYEKEKFYAAILSKNYEEKEIPVLKEAKGWLDIYFSGCVPDFMPKIHLIGSAFQLSVWKILQDIPYGCTTTYGDIAQKIAKERGIAKMSAQAVGGAVGRNNISIIIPCHRVIGKNGSLTGYAGGLDKKMKLLEIEGLNQQMRF